MRSFLAFKVMLFTVLVPGTVILYFPYALVLDADSQLRPANLSLSIPAALCILLGMGFYLRCAWDFAVEGLGTPAPIDPPNKLVVAGLYQRTRNPMYQGMLLLLSAECLLFPNPELLIYAGSVALIFHAFVVLYEEPNLRGRFGESYINYCSKVPRWGYSIRPFTRDGAR